MKLDFAIFGALIIIAASGILAGDDLTIDYFYEMYKDLDIFQKRVHAPTQFSVFKATCVVVFAYYSWNFLATRAIFWMHGPRKYHVASFMSHYLYLGKFGVETTLALDGQPEEVMALRRKGVEWLSKVLNSAKDTHVDTNMTDCRFKKIKVLFPLLRDLELPIPNFVKDIEGHEVILNDDTKRLHVGCDAVRYFDQKFYNECEKETFQKLAANNCKFSSISLTPEIVQHSERMAKMTKTDEVRYCLSGSEAVDIALKDAKTSTCKKKIVRFKNAYHGHISGISNDSPDQIYLNEMDDDALDFIEEYHYKIAAVIVNPMQFLSGPNNLSPPGEKVTFGKRDKKRVTREEYAEWLHKLNVKCQYVTKFLTPVAFVLDDIYFAFRTKEIFSFRYFSHLGEELEPDMVILGKGLAGGFPLAMVCGKSNFMNRYDRSYILKVNRSVGTMSAWEGGVVASSVFLDKMEANLTEFERINKKFNKFTEKTNARFEKEQLPFRVTSFANVFTIDYKINSLYNSMYPQFLMAEGIYFSNQSTGKFNLSDEWSESALDELSEKMINAAMKMAQFGFAEPKRSKFWFARVLNSFLYNYIRCCYDQIMLDKHIDIEVSHNHDVNRCGHFWSSIGMIFVAYPLMWYGHLAWGSFVFLATHVVRQAGHFFYEKQDRDYEKMKFGHKDHSKKVATVGVFASLAIYFYRDRIPLLMNIINQDQLAVLFCLLTIIPHFSEICHKFGWLRGWQWLIKIVTDPFTDLIDFYPYIVISPKLFLDVNFLSGPVDVKWVSALTTSQESSKWSTI